MITAEQKGFIKVFKLYIGTGYLFNTIFNFQCYKSKFLMDDNTSQRRVHGKTTYEWHTDDIRVHTSDIRMTYESMRVTYGWHTSTYERYTVDIRVHTSDMQMTYEYIRLAYEWDDMRMTFKWHNGWHAVRKKNSYLFKSFLIILFQNIWFVKEFLHAMAVLGCLIKLK